MQMDSALWDGRTNRVGVVMALENTRRAISVARQVLERSIHNVFAGEGALKFKREVCECVCLCVCVCVCARVALEYSTW